MQNDYLDTLNPAQRRAVENFTAPSLIVAGAGSGKTRVLTCRIAHMIESGVAAQSILALTFTNKAAREMRERIEGLVSKSMSRGLWMGTFHSIFARMLRKNGELLGYDESFTIYDTADSTAMIRKIIKELELSDEQYKPRDIQSRISFAKNNLVTAEIYNSNAAIAEEDASRRRSQTGQIYTLYTQRCKANNAMDFDDLLLNVNTLLRDFPQVLDAYRDRFRYILVDEYQDTNNAQYAILRRLASEQTVLCVVGDDAQSIYSFRGAKIENILRFRTDFPNAEEFVLGRNYRSTQTIVDAANSLIKKNQNRIQKEVYSENETGEPIKVLEAATDREEAEMVTSRIRAVGRQNSMQWSGIAVLYRTNAQSRALEESLRRRNIPYRIYGGFSFYEYKEVKDLLAYFRLIVNPSDNEAFRRIVNYPSRGIGDVTVNKLDELSRERNISLWQAAESIEGETEGEFRLAAKKIGAFLGLMRSMSLQREQLSLYQFGELVASSSGMTGLFKNDPSPESDVALDNIAELLSSMSDAKIQQAMLNYSPEEEQEELGTEPSLEEWLQNITLLTDMDAAPENQDQNKVTLMTVHAAKGLEFDTVFVVGMEENLFPSVRSLASNENIEEERRLFYVALTRAKRLSTLSYARQRFKWGNMEFCRPSRFLKEIDPQYLDLSEAGSQQKKEPLDPVEVLRRKFEAIQSGQEPAPASRRSGGYQSRQTPQPTDMSRFRSVGSKPKTEAATAPQVDRVESAHVGASDYNVGCTVEHAKFGLGRVTAVENTGTDLKITVIFADDAVGSKTLLGKYAKLKIVE